MITGDSTLQSSDETRTDGGSCRRGSRPVRAGRLPRPRSLVRVRLGVVHRGIRLPDPAWAALWPTRERAAAGAPWPCGWHGPPDRGGPPTSWNPIRACSAPRSLTSPTTAVPY